MFFYQVWRLDHHRTDSLAGCSLGCRELWSAPSCGGDAAERDSGHVMDSHVFLENTGSPCQMCIYDLTCGAVLAVAHDVPGLTCPRVHHTKGSWPLHHRIKPLGSSHGAHLWVWNVDIGVSSTE